MNTETMKWNQVCKSSRSFSDTNRFHKTVRLQNLFIDYIAALSNVTFFDYDYTLNTPAAYEVEQYSNFHPRTICHKTYSSMDNFITQSINPGLIQVRPDIVGGQI